MHYRACQLDARLVRGTAPVRSAHERSHRPHDEMRAREARTTKSGMGTPAKCLSYHDVDVACGFRSNIYFFVIGSSSGRFLSREETAPTSSCTQLAFPSQQQAPQTEHSIATFSPNADRFDPVTPVGAMYVLPIVSLRTIPVPSRSAPPALDRVEDVKACRAHR